MKKNIYCREKKYFSSWKEIKTVGLLSWNTKLDANRKFVNLPLEYCLKHFQISKKSIKFALDNLVYNAKDIFCPLFSSIIIIKKS